MLIRDFLNESFDHHTNSTTESLPVKKKLHKSIQDCFVELGRYIELHKNEDFIAYSLHFGHFVVNGFQMFGDHFCGAPFNLMSFYKMHQFIINKNPD